ncbi:polysaccharide export protein [Gluconobacter cerinus]|uniref:Capsule biosynthesis protein n=2 Tax=Gluconobacter cerinus TaxID=38307 RepID=A0A1B6VP25_9PROT|nr:polysaccharide biosynthesis/export family protein [Gluconobacter oxydans]MBM3096673.1 polysaccharide export protein [Gluconobacter cerinus]OAJ68727.1 capsule biosynthesis protein [Gluconobacter cerinus]
MRVDCFPSSNRSPLRMALLLGALSLSGCSALPGNAPTESVVLKAATDKNKNPLGFLVTQVTPEVTKVLATEQPPLISSLYADSSRLIPNDRIGVGDVLNITVFELGSGLFSGAAPSVSSNTDLSAASGATGSVTHQTLPPTEVEADGTLTIPYVGRLHVVGMTPQNLAEKIRTALTGKSQNAEVMVHIGTDISNTVIISGAVHHPGRVLLSTAQERLSDVVAIAGGANYPPEDTFVQLVRGNKSGGTDLGTLETYPKEDIPARPGDRIHVVYQPRSYTVFGAASKNAMQVDFNSPTVNLAEAIARVGGPNDSLADPNAVFLFRFEDTVAAKALHLQTPETLQGIPVIYKLDMMNPSSYFLAQRIPIKSKDVILIANAKTDRFYKFNQLISTLISPAITAAWIAR